jgi:two-component system response regulator
MSESNGDTILLVEDNPSDAELTLHALKKQKLANHIEWAHEGADALDFIFCRGAHVHRNASAPPRLILLDLKLPKVDGLQVLQLIKSDDRTKSIPVIVLTSSNEESDLVSSYRFGVNSYIQKPVNFSEFQEVVKQLGLYWLLVNSTPPAAAFASA